MINLFDLNARHEALLIWLMVALCASSGFRSLTRLAIQGLFGRLLLPFLTGLLVYVSALTMLAVIAGRSVGLFSELPVFSACLWFIAALFPLAGRAIRTGSWAGPLREYLMHSPHYTSSGNGFSFSRDSSFLVGIPIVADTTENCLDFWIRIRTTGFRL